ncbi:MAG: 2-oxoglutarate dehydrogenase complex dihydrolipoyllysine-residue succinyltransferase [Planctomycetota bacterium]|jgi:2-oxoglutarate dehydrogenase E2 component (dihydrolipoamide succinyltransferase)
MAFEVQIPAVGESITEGVLSRWLVDDGSYVSSGTPIYELETDKISTEVEAEVDGVITFVVGEGDTLAVGTHVANIDTDASAPTPASTQAAKAAAGTADADDDADTHHAPTEATHQQTPQAEAHAAPLSPAVRLLVEEHGLNPGSIPATGKDGRLTKGDVLAFLERDKASPAPGLSAQPAVTNASAGTSTTKRTRMTPLRKKIAQRLVNAQRTAAILTTFNEVDMSACMALRKRFKDRFEEVHGTRLGFMSFFTKAAIEALKTYPLINAQIDGDDIVEFEHINVGIAVGTPKGLMVPVLKEAEDMGFADIEREIRVYAKKARDSKISLDDMAGGTFTISNGGAYGSLMSTPILNPPQSGILGMHAINDRPVAVNGEVVIRPMMYIALSYDHRIVDGAEAVGFLVRIKELIEEPERLIFDL